jgi:hypothetical protein
MQNNLDLQAFDSYAKYTRSLGQEPLSEIDWLQQRWGIAKARRGTAADMRRLQQRHDARKRLAAPEPTTLRKQATQLAPLPHCPATEQPR